MSYYYRYFEKPKIKTLFCGLAYFAENLDSTIFLEAILLFFFEIM